MRIIDDLATLNRLNKYYLSVVAVVHETLGAVDNPNKYFKKISQAFHEASFDCFGRYIVTTVKDALFDSKM